MHLENFFYNCSKEYLESISPTLYGELSAVISRIPKRSIQAEINKDLFVLLTAKGWSYDSLPMGISDSPPEDLKVEIDFDRIKRNNNRQLCLTSSTLGAKWHADFGKIYNGKIVQIEAQFGTVESMFKDFCGFQIVQYERRLALGIEIVLCEPTKYFSHRKAAISGMAYFDIAMKTLPAIGLDCPIWLVGIKE